MFLIIMAIFIINIINIIAVKYVCLEIAKNNIDITIGIKYNSWNQNLLSNFDITKYRYYKRALTASEILALYTNKL